MKNFHKNVFINCPFDTTYKILLQPLLFTIIYLEFNPLIASDKSSSKVRIKKIIKLIRSSKYSIHDISRSKPLKINDLPRFNLPYELGLDIGCKTFGNEKFRKKKILILDTKRNHFKKVISDISGQDIQAHEDNLKI